MKCWICETECEGDECPKCGSPEPWGPTPAELLLEAQQLYDDEKEDWEGDDAYARDLCIKRHGPI